jgi:ABC-type multidrug transport system fused ATPase/permease subunit
MPADFLETVNSLSREMMAVILLLFLFNLSAGIINGCHMPYILQELRTGVMESIMRQNISFFDSQDPSVTLSRLSEDPQNAYNGFTDKVIALVRCSLQLAIGVGLMSSVHWKLCVTALCLFPGFAMSTVFGSTALERLWVTFNEKSTDVSAKAHEILSSFRTVRSFDAELREYQ